MVTGGDGSLLLHKYRYPDQRCAQLAAHRPWDASGLGGGGASMQRGSIGRQGSCRQLLLGCNSYAASAAPRPRPPSLLPTRTALCRRVIENKQTGEKEGVVGSAELLCDRDISCQPVAAFDWSPDKARQLSKAAELGRSLLPAILRPCACRGGMPNMVAQSCTRPSSPRRPACLWQRHLTRQCEWAWWAAPPRYDSAAAACKTPSPLSAPAPAFFQLQSCLCATAVI